MRFLWVLLPLLAQESSEARFEPFLVVHTGDTVIAPPEGVHPFYKKYINADGIVVVGSENVADAALLAARRTILRLTSTRPDIHQAIVANHARVSIMAISETASDLPEFGPASDGEWGLGQMPGDPTSLVSEEGIPYDGNESYDANFLLHELVHVVHNLGMPTTDPEMVDAIYDAYLRAVDEGRFMTPPDEPPRDITAFDEYRDDEYFTHSVNAYYDLNESLPGPWVDIEIGDRGRRSGTREELKRNDPRIVEIIEQFFPDSLESARVQSNYGELLEIFEEFRAFSRADVEGDIADYPSAMATKARGLREFQERLAALDVSDWPVAEQVDYHLVRAEMNGLDFELRVIRRWERDPAFYSLQRAGLSELGSQGKSVDELRSTLAVIPGFFESARANLGGGDISKIAGDFAVLMLRSTEPAAERLAEYLTSVVEEHPALEPDARAARSAFESYREWLRSNVDEMTEPAGVGRDNYNWLLKNVYLFPYTWEECRQIVNLEDNRVLTFLRLEQNRNRNVPPLEPVSSQEDYRQSVMEALDHIDRFIREQEIYTVPDYLVDDEYRQGRIDATSGPWPERHDYFQVFSHREPLMEETHELVGHHYDLLRQQNGSHPIRNAREHEGPYNMSVARWEGLAFAHEELLMHSGYLDGRSPRSREIVYEQAAFRTVRALSDLYQHAREWDMETAFEYSIEHAPHGERLRGSNQLWAEVADTNLRMVGWHTQMVVGKVQFMKLLRDRSQQLGDAFVLEEFMDEFYGLGALPMSLIRWEMIGYDDEIKTLW